ncbi:MAG: hypothetical protein J7J38_02370 [Candidatus Aenigmarchaeota archaeon]|nr:hypothetical protein [Candidatus Aenigmarchaeota archaeon]
MQLPTKRPGYWSVYHSIRRYDFLKIFKAIQTFVNKAGDPWEISERGRPPEILPKEYGTMRKLNNARRFGILWKGKF